MPNPNEIFDSSKLKSSVRTLTERARQSSGQEKEALLAAARTHLLLAKNAAWIESTNDFLRAVNKGSRWPHPRTDVGPAESLD
jgi:hypothetical protein